MVGGPGNDRLDGGPVEIP
ncbi:hypothetical protein [Egbenema bharatensis]